MQNVEAGIKPIVSPILLSKETSYFYLNQYVMKREYT